MATQGSDRTGCTGSDGTRRDVLEALLADQFGDLTAASVTGLTAYAGGGQTSATAMTARDNNFTTVATAADSAKLPTARAGLTVIVRNNGAAALAVFPASGGAINGGSTNASVTLPAGTQMSFTAISSTAWYAQAPASLAGSPAVSGQTASPRVLHTGGLPARVSTDGTNATPVTTETYIAEVFVPCNMTITGGSVMNGATVGTDKGFVYLCDSTGAVVANSATAGATTSGADAYQDYAFTAAYAAKGLATYYLCYQMNGTTDRYNAHPFGRFGAGKKTSTVFGTAAAITPPTTFTADLGPIATLY